MPAPFSCEQYYSFLFDRSPHFVDPILRDWYPNDDAWIGHVKTMPWESFTGTQHVRDRIHVGAPDMSQPWQLFDTSEDNFISAPEGNDASACVSATTPEIAVGWGSTRTTFNRYRTRYTTNPLYFDQIETRAKAKEQMAEIVKGIKDMTKMIQSDYLRTASLMFGSDIYICSAAAITSTTPSIPVTSTTFNNLAGQPLAQASFVDIGGAGNLPQSALSVQYLQRFWEPLVFEGYFRERQYVPNGMMKLITDPINSQQLTNGNPALTHGYKFTDFNKGGELYKYGVSAAVGNTAIAWDGFPMRFYWDAGNNRLRRVWPFVNIPATIGVKRKVAYEYLVAPYQISQVWHPEAMVRYVPSLTQVNPDMPFMTRDLGGKWQFFGGARDKTLVVTTVDPITGLPVKTIIDNKAGNIGLFWAEFQNAIEFQKPELVRSILHQREPGCVTDLAVCSTAPAYVQQSWAANQVCCTT